MDELQRRIAATQTVHDVFVEVLIDDELDHGINPFARRTVEKFLAHTARLALFHWREPLCGFLAQRRRYSSKGTGFAK